MYYSYLFLVNSVSFTLNSFFWSNKGEVILQKTLQYLMMDEAVLFIKTRTLLNARMGALEFSSSAMDLYHTIHEKNDCKTQGLANNFNSVTIKVWLGQVCTSAWAREPATPVGVQERLGHSCGVCPRRRLAWRGRSGKFLAAGPRRIFRPLQQLFCSQSNI